MSLIFYDAHRRSVRIGRKIGSGGEGDIFEVEGRPEQVAKIYFPDKVPADPEKLRYMIGAQTEALARLTAWPLDTLHERRGVRQVAGFLMPFVPGGSEIHNLYLPEFRRQHFPNADWRFLTETAIYCAAAVEEVHRSGFVIGDLNQNNTMVLADARIALVDCDSFQVRTAAGKIFRCGVGMTEFTPPELQGIDRASVDREENHDRFGLAVLVFYLLIVGRHPYFGVRADKKNLNFEEAIRRHEFAYTGDTNRRQSVPPRGAPELSILPFSLRVLFERAFAPDAATAGRPAAGEWRTALTEFRDQLKPCANDPAHYFHPVATTCPWCQLAETASACHFGDPPKSKPKPKPKPQKATSQTGPATVLQVFGLLAACIVLFAAMLAAPRLEAFDWWRVESLLEESAKGSGAERARIEARLVRVGPSAIPKLVAHLPDSRPNMRGTAERVLVQIDPRWEKSEGARQAVPALCEHLHRMDKTEIIRAVRLLTRIGPPGREVIRELSEKLLQNDQWQRGSGPEVQAEALEAILAIDPQWKSSPDGKQVVQYLLDQLECSKYRNGLVLAEDPIESKVFYVLGLLDHGARPAVWPLIWELEHHDEAIRVAARNTLDRIDPNWRHELIAEYRTQYALSSSSTNPTWFKHFGERERLEKLLDKTSPGWRKAWTPEIRNERKERL